MKRMIPAFGGMLALFLLVGCGGGGGGSSQSPYTGLTSAAQLSDANVADVVTEAYQAGDLTAVTVVPLRESGPGASGAGTPKAVALVRLLRDVTEKVEGPAVSPSRPLSAGSAVPMDVVTWSETIDDGFGGTATFSLTIDTVTGDFSGTFVFTNWHGEGGATISGSASATGNYDQVAGEFSRIRFTFHSVTMVDGAASVTVSGTVDMSLSPSLGTATIEMYITDDLSGKCVWIHGYTVVMTEGPDASPADGIPDYTDTDILGRIYLHDHGYVSVSTPVSFRYYPGYVNPASGILLVTGSQGRSARFVVNDGIPESAGYYIEADLEPDGIYEWRTIDFPWA